MQNAPVHRVGSCIGILFICLFARLSGFTQSHQISFTQVYGTNGVSLGKINGMTRDKYGFMWFSDETNHAIVRFDGSHMTVFQHNPTNANSLGGFYPECLESDSSGNIWIGFYGMGLDKLNPVTRQFTHYRYDKNDQASLSNDSVTSLLVDHLGKVWVGNYGGLDLLDEKTGKFTHYRNYPSDSTSLSHDRVRGLYEDKSGVIWVGTGFFATEGFDTYGGLNRLHRETGTFTRYLHDPKNPRSLIDNKVRSMLEDSYGNFWVGTSGDGLHTMDRKTGLFTRHPYDPSKPLQLSRPPLAMRIDHITFIREDALKNIWIGTMENGLTRYDLQSGELVRYGMRGTKGGNFKDSTSWWAYASPDGLLWVSTQDANLYRIDLFNTIVPHLGNSGSDGVNAFCEEADSVMWYGTTTGLLRKQIKTGTIRRYINEPGNPKSISNSQVNWIMRDRKGKLWIGTASGLNKYDPQSNGFTRYYPRLNQPDDLRNYISCIREDKDSKIWFSTVGDGLAMLDPASGKISYHTHDVSDLQSIGSDSISNFIEDDSGNVWISYYSGGLDKMNLNTFRCSRYDTTRVINTLYKDPTGKLWIGAVDGLFYYDHESGRFKQFAADNAGYNIYEISSIVSDKDNNLWIGTETGVFEINKNRNQLTRYGKEYGFKDANAFFAPNAAYITRSGELNFGDGIGYYVFYPDKLKSFPGKTEVYFTGFWIDNKEIMPGNGSPLEQSLYDVKTIRLDYNQNVFSFSSTFVDFRSPADKKIYYMLEPYDKDWRTVSVEDRMHYSGVPAGNYIFRIKTQIGGNDQWTEKSIEIIISPPWWRRWWAYFVYGLLLVASIVMIDRFQKERLIRKEREKTRARELAQAKEIEKAYNELRNTQSQLVQSEKMASLGELTAGIAHEIQNPLNFVNNFSEVNRELIQEMSEELKNGNIEQAKRIGSAVADNEEKIVQHGKRADSIVKSMLQHSYTGTASKEPTDINALINEYARLAYHGLRAKDKDFNVTLKEDFDQTIGNVDLIPQEIGRVVLNLINNAFYAVAQKKKYPQRPEVGFNYEPRVEVSTKAISTASGARAVEIRITDNGIGIPRKIVDKVFQPFFTTKPSGQGTGLGLSLSYDIIKAHGGELSLDSKEGEYASFIIVLPLKRR